MSIQYHMKINEKWRSDATNAMRQGLTRMATDIHKMAVVNAPKRTHALANSGVIKMSASGLKATVTFGNSRVDYAEIRELTNHLHPDTVRYLERAGAAAQAKMSSYFSKGI